jgi:hypothetical protein
MSRDALTARLVAADPASDLTPDRDVAEALLGRVLSSAPGASPGAHGGRRLVQRARRLSLVAQLAWTVVSLSALGGVTTAVYLAVFGGEPPARQIPRFECIIHNGVGIATYVTGDPVVDCAALWVRSGSVVPPLAAWTSPYGGDAVVRRASLGPPPFGSGWQRLPAGWTVDLPVVELDDQLNDISTGMADGDACTYAKGAVRLARSLLVADDLPAWRVTLRANNGPLSSGCRHIAPDVDGATRTIQLIQIQAERPTRNSAPTHQPTGRQRNPKPSARLRLVPSLQQRRRDYTHALELLLVAQRRTNRALSARCETVPQAAALWTRQAAAMGLAPATAAFWRAFHAEASFRAHEDVLPNDFFLRYTLLLQPASQHTGGCAHLLVQDDGGDNLIVYAARMAP